MDIKEVATWLTENKYMKKTAAGGFSFTKKWRDDLKNSGKIAILDAPQNENKPVQSIATVNQPDLYPVPERVAKYNYQDWCRMYNNFIAEAKVPARITTSNGFVFAGNKFTEPGMLAYQKAIKEGCDGRILMGAVRLYYASTVDYKKAIGSYMAAGEWRTDYQTLAASASEGVEALQQHVDDELKVKQHKPYSIGF